MKEKISVLNVLRVEYWMHFQENVNVSLDTKKTKMVYVDNAINCKESVFGNVL